MKPVNLKTEYVNNPCAVEVEKPRFSWTIEVDHMQSAYHIIAGGDVQLSEDNLFWDSGKVLSDENICIEYDGRPIPPDTTVYWKVAIWDEGGTRSQDSEAAFFSTGLCGNWIAKWIGMKEGILAVPLVRRDFSCNDSIKKATAYVYSPGWYVFYVNGTKADDRVLAPSHSKGDVSLLYDTYDILPLLAKGDNALGLMLGDGYNHNYSQFGWHWDGQKRAIVQVEIQYEDGRAERIATGEGWKYTFGPIVSSHIYNGENYDARLEIGGWNKPGFDDSGWYDAQILDLPTDKLVASIVPPIKVMKQIKPVKKFKADGVWIFDFGQNFAGWVRIKVKAGRGKKIILRHSENINEVGQPDTWTNRRAAATDTYIARSDETEIFEPSFTYHGFRYVEVLGIEPNIDDVTGCVIHSSFETVGSFSCSDSLINQIESNMLWGMKSNLVSFPTDCPQRDERTPCLMDSAVYEEAALMRFGMHGYYLSWLLQIRGDTGTPDWGGDQLSLCYHLYNHFGDVRVVCESYDFMATYIEANAERLEDGIIVQGYGDWCAPNLRNLYEDSSLSVSQTNTALFFYHLNLMAKMAQIIGKNDDAKKYADLAEEVKAGYNKAFFSGTSYSGGKQTPNVLALCLGLVPDNLIETVASSLANDIKKRGNHLDTGIYGTRFLLDALADNGHIDTAYEVLTSTGYPGFGFTISQGATTLWEQWSAYLVGMQSHNHAMFSGIGVSFFTRLVGIRNGGDAYKNIVIKPIIPAKLSSARGETETIRGTIKSAWSKECGKLRLEVTIPFGSSAMIYFPGALGADVRATCGASVGYEDGFYVYEVGGGRYCFEEM